MKQISDAKNLPEEQKFIYNNTFRDFNMKIVEFMKVFAIAERRLVKKGEKLVSEGTKHHQLHYIVHGHVEVFKNFEKVNKYGPGQFVGALSFLSWENRIELKKKLEAKAKQEYLSWNRL